MRTVCKKELINTKLANNYGGWIYCNACQKTIGYLCYVTYDQFHLAYICNCGNEGRIDLIIEDKKEPAVNSQSLVKIKNRSCCPVDQSPLFTIQTEKLKRYTVETVCSCCHESFKEEKENTD